MWGVAGSPFADMPRTPPPIPPPSPLQVWLQYEEAPVEEVVMVPEEKERTANYKAVFVTEITDDLHFYVQDVETGEACGETDAAAAPRARGGGGALVLGLPPAGLWGAVLWLSEGRESPGEPG